MSVSFNIVCSWPTSWSVTDVTVLSRSVSSPTFNVLLSWAERVWQLSDTFITSCVIMGRPVRSCACSTLKPWLSSDEHVWGLPVQTTVCPVLSFFGPFSWKERVVLRTGSFFSILYSSHVICNDLSPRSLTTWIWNWLVRLKTPR